MKKLFLFLGLALLCGRSFAQTYSNLDDSLSGWQSPPCYGPSCAGGTGTATGYFQTINNSSPSLDGESMEVGFTAQSGLSPGQTTNVLWPNKVGANSAITTFDGIYHVYLPSVSTIQALEFDQFQFLSGQRFMMGSECDSPTLAGGYWRIWNQYTASWVSTSVPCTLLSTAATWHSVEWKTHRIPGDTSCSGGNPCMYYDSLTVDGTVHLLSLALPSAPSSDPSNIGIQFQIDAGSSATTVSAYLDEMSLTLSTDPTITVSTTTGGFVTDNQAQIDCPTMCAGNYLSGTVVVLTATPTSSGYSFAGWSGGGCSGTGTCSITATSNQSVSAAFIPVSGTTSLLQQNLTATSNSFSIASNVVTISASNTFGGNAWVYIWGCTNATQLNGQVLYTNGSTNLSQVVGTLYNTQQTPLALANVSTTADTTCGLYGQGWNPFPGAPFPAPGAPSCANGNGSPGCAVGDGINTWARDFSVPCGPLNNAPCANIVQVASRFTASSHASLVPSLTGESYDHGVSLPDGAGGYFYSLVNEGRQDIFHLHLDPTHCGGTQCPIADVTSDANAWTSAPVNYGAFSRNYAFRPGVNQALWYNVSEGNPYAPVLNSWVLNYASNAVTATLSNAQSPYLPYNLNTCPGFAYLTVGTGLAVVQAFITDNFDHEITLAMGSGVQGGTGRHLVFTISLVNGTCQTWDTAGYTGTGLLSAGVTSGHAGTGWTTGNTATLACGATLTVTASGGAVTAVAIATRGVNCYIGSGFAATGAGSGLELDVTGIGAPGTTSTLYAPIASASCPAGNNTTLTCETPSATSVDAYGIHGGGMLGNGLYAYNSGWGATNQGCSGCDYVAETLGSSPVVTPSTSGSQNGHPSLGYNWMGTAANPTYYENRLVSAYADPGCTNSADCYLLFTLPSGGAGGNCSVTPGGSQMHSAQAMPTNDDTWPVLVTSSINTPGTPTQTNPPGFTGALCQNSLFTINKATGQTNWYIHHYENGNNLGNGENFEGPDTICTVAPDGVFALCPNDALSGFAPNAGSGTDNAGKPYVNTYAVMLSIPTPSSVLVTAPLNYLAW